MMTVDLLELRPEAIEAADARALELLEGELTGMAQSRPADMLRRTSAPEAEQLGALTDAIKAFSASVGPTDPQPTSAFGRLAHVAPAAQAIEIAVAAGMQAIADA